MSFLSFNSEDLTVQQSSLPSHVLPFHRHPEEPSNTYINMQRLGSTRLDAKVSATKSSLK